MKTKLSLSQSFRIDWSTIDGGGGTSTGGIYSVSGTIGQPDAGALTGNGFSLTGGFWALPAAIQTEGAPTLTIIPAGLGQAQISWAPDTGTNWVLQETLSLTPTNWTDSASGPTNPVIVPTSPSIRYFRLHKP